MWRNGVISCCVWVLKNTHVDRKKTQPRIFNDVEYGLSFIRETLFFTCFPLPSDMKRRPVLLVKKNPYWALKHLISSVSALNKNMMFGSHFWCKKKNKSRGWIHFFRSFKVIYCHWSSSSCVVHAMMFFCPNANLMRFYKRWVPL